MKGKKKHQGTVKAISQKEERKCEINKREIRLRIRDRLLGIFLI
jgi:hypothetical protein